MKTKKRETNPEVRCFSRARLHDSVPYTQLLSNGRYTTLISNAGSGLSTFEDIALTHWRGDRIEDADGFFLYLRDLESGHFWSLGHQPVRQNTERYEASFSPDSIQITCVNQGIEAHMQVCVAPDADLELRRCTLYNRSSRVRRIELTSFAELALNQPAAHAAHPAFSKLFVQTEQLSETGALLARRRRRSPDESTPVAAHWTITEHPIAEMHYETDRTRFLGRGKTAADPRALNGPNTLNGAVGNVLDPVFCLRRIVDLPPQSSAEISFALGAADTREAAVALISRYQTPVDVERAFQQAADYVRDHLKRLDISYERAQLYQQFAGALLYGDPSLRADSQILEKQRGQRTELASHGLEIDRPLVLVWLRDSVWQDRVELFCKAHSYWNSLALATQLLFLLDKKNHGQSGEVLRYIEQRRPKTEGAAGKGNIVVLDSERLTKRELILMQCNAQAVIDRQVPDLLPKRAGPETSEPNAKAQFLPAAQDPPVTATIREANPLPEEALLFDNGQGGFTQNGKEYVITLSPPGPILPPLPWTNVIANEQFGTIVSERGTGFSWSQNSREHRLTPWSNDPISDPHAEALYLRDEQARVFWSPTPGPVAQDLSYTVRHGFGYTQYEHVSQSLEQRVCVFVPRRDPLKIVRLRLRNLGDRTRKLSLFSYLRLVLGVSPEQDSASVMTAFDTKTEALMAWNRSVDIFASRTSFAKLVACKATDPVAYSTDRKHFIGRNGDTSRPAALCREARLNGRTGTGLDPCMALQLRISVAPTETFDCALLFGEADDSSTASELIARYGTEAALDDAFAELRSFWDGTLCKLQIQTPVPAVDVMVNGWLAYQNLSCRIWGRSAFYQSGGAFGFRDQLQDAAALIHLLPELTREQILLHAAHQFPEGDVLHWWHPPDDRGIRTRFSDDLLWLPFVCAYYVHTTGDDAILDQETRFICARALRPGEDEAFLSPQDSSHSADLYEHCCRALDRSLTQGAHGLPLMGTGDWNDGMNRVGREGRGESVWLGFFIYHILRLFTPLCETRGDRRRVERYSAFRSRLGKALNETGWDGAWYRRAYFDDGTPLGSAQNEECRIDALAQAWAVISGVAPPERVEQAMDALEAYLVSEPEGIIRLLTPAFDKVPWDPGYIKGYVAGVRENGGQYTHGVLWALQALAEAGRHERAATLMEMVSPVSHARTIQELEVYRVEPYVIAADIYGVHPHVGRGGWTWYTGSAGWMLRITLESLLGFGVEGGHRIVLKPRIPKSWPNFCIRYRTDEATRYEISVSNVAPGEGKVVFVSVDGDPLEPVDGLAIIPLRHDGVNHRVEVNLA